MTRPFSMGVGLIEFVTSYARANSVTDAQMLTAVDNFKNSLADRLGLAHTDVASAYLYPSSVTIWLDLYGGYPTDPAPIGTSFPSDTLMDGLRDRGIMPILLVEPAGTKANGGVDYASWPTWVAGAYDDWALKLGKDAKKWANNANSTGLNRQGQTKSSVVAIRFASEQNGTWTPYSIGKVYNGIKNTGADFKKGWRRFYQKAVTEAGAKNLRFFYCPYGIKNGSMESQYPGDAYVYYTGFDIYCGNWPEAAAKSMLDIYTPLYNRMRRKAPGKSMIVGETGINADRFTDVQRGHWIDGGDTFGGNAGGYAAIVSGLKLLRGVTWFNINMHTAPISASPDWTLEQGGSHLALTAYANAASALSVSYQPEHNLRPARDAWIARAVGGSTNYGNAATEKITVGPIVSSNNAATVYKGRGLFGWSAAQMAYLLGQVPSFFSASLTFTVADEEVGTRGASPYFFLEVLSGAFDSLKADKNGTALTNSQLYTQASKPKALWPGPTAVKTNRIFVDATGKTTGSTIVVDMTTIIQARIDNGDTSALDIRLIACDSTGSTYDEANTARTISLYSSKSEGNEPVLAVRLAVNNPGAVSMSDGIGITDTMTVANSPIFSVDGENGVIQFKGRNQSNKAVLASVSEDGVLVHSAFSVEKLPKGGFVYYRLLARYIDVSNYYELILTMSPSGNLKMSLGKLVAGVETILLSHDAPIDIVKKQRYFVRLYAIGTTPTFLSAKVWAEGTVEPDPMLSLYDTAAALQTTGAVGLGASDGNVSNLPLSLDVDEFWAAPL